MSSANPAQLTLQAPAKINPFLHIVGKRTDGYHLLDTAFQLMDLHDTVRLALRFDGQIQLHTPIEGLLDSQHLAVRAAHLLKSHCPADQALGVDIWVEKNIPSGAGLGGGSSDAATTLLGLNQLWACGLPRGALQTLGLQLGADVPFFCSGFAAARASGIGEVLSPLTASKRAYLLVYPNCHVPTPTVFRHPDLTWSDKQAIISGLEAIDDLADHGHNDLQGVAQKIAPQIKQVVDGLKLCAQVLQKQSHDQVRVTVRMTGSGSAVFAAFDDAGVRDRCFEMFSQSMRENRFDGLIWKLKTLAKHPFDALNQS